jgi:hypothetical protein
MGGSRDASASDAKMPEIRLISIVRACDAPLEIRDQREIYGAGKSQKEQIVQNNQLWPDLQVSEASSESSRYRNRRRPGSPGVGQVTHRQPITV